MKNLVFVLMIVMVALAFGQSSMKSQQEVMNYNYNWGRLKSDTLRVTTVIDTVVLTAKAYNVLIWPIDGDVTFKASNDSRYWPHWVTIPSGNALTLAGGKVDSLFLKSAGAVTTNIIYTVF